MQVTVTMIGDKELERDLKRFGRDFPKVMNSMLRYAGNKFVKHAREVAGRFLSVRRNGKLWRSLRVRKTRGRSNSYIVLGPRLANIFEHPGGATITPKKKQSLAWGGAPGARQPHHAKRVHLDPRPFLTTAQNTFNFEQATNEAISKIMDRELKKRGFI